jgi:multidrug transporter EmrE-like cation transporter
MKRAILLGFLLLMTFDTAAQVGMKFAGDRIASSTSELIWVRRVVREPLVYLVLSFYIGAFVTYTTLLRYAPVGPSYAAAHGHIVAVMVISLLFMGETFTLLQTLGACCILSGITILALTEKPVSPSGLSSQI